jgi:hypothetical protein
VAEPTAKWKYASMARASDSTLIVLEARDENNVEVFRGQFFTLGDAVKALDAFDKKDED